MWRGERRTLAVIYPITSYTSPPPFQRLLSQGEYNRLADLFTTAPRRGRLFFCCLERRQSKESRLSSLMVSAHGSGKCLQCRRVSTVMVCYTALIHTHVHIHDGKSNHEFMHHAYEVPKTLANPRWYDRYLRLRGRVDWSFRMRHLSSGETAANQ